MLVNLFLTFVFIVCVARCSHPRLSVVVHCVHREWSGASWAVEMTFQILLVKLHSACEVLVEFRKLLLMWAF